MSHSFAFAFDFAFGFAFLLHAFYREAHFIFVFLDLRINVRVKIGDACRISHMSREYITSDTDSTSNHKEDALKQMRLLVRI